MSTKLKVGDAVIIVQSVNKNLIGKTGIISRIYMDLLKVQFYDGWTGWYQPSKVVLATPMSKAIYE